MAKTQKTNTPPDQTTPTKPVRKAPVKKPQIEAYPLDGNGVAIKALSLYTDINEVYVGSKGAIFPASTFTRGLSDDAKLYTNPFFKKQ